MKIAIDNIEYLSKLQNNKDDEIIFVFDKEPLEELLKIDIHCVNKDKIIAVDINLTNYYIPCVKKCTIDDDLTLPPSKDYKYAIIVPNCNNDHGDIDGKTFFSKCIESILNQSYQNFELIIVDDMSTDSSVKTVQSYMKKKEYAKKIHLIQNTRKRFNGGTRNIGIDYALNNIDFDYFAFLDSDDWWTTEKTLEIINKYLNGHEMALIGMQLVDQNGVFMTKTHIIDCYEDFFLSDNKVWCTAWARIIRKDKIVYFPEDTLMEDRTWSYEQADNVDYNHVVNIKEILYTWNRTNVSNSVSLVRGKNWEASAWKHIGQQLMLLTRLKHNEMRPILEKRIQECINKVNHRIYQQY